MFVLGIDPGLTRTGYGLVEAGSPPIAHFAGAIVTETALTAAERLYELKQGLDGVLTRHLPDSVAIERTFTNRNLQTAISVGRASGVALATAAEHGVPVFEYAPTAVKLAITGDGNAGKRAVQSMVARLLGLAVAPRPADASDALAIALCHLRSARMGLKR
jgi:crossover junction endodeoxyribonuclease RuvC